MRTNKKIKQKKKVTFKYKGGAPITIFLNSINIPTYNLKYLNGGKNGFVFKCNMRDVRHENGTLVPHTYILKFCIDSPLAYEYLIGLYLNTLIDEGYNCFIRTYALYFTTVAYYYKDSHEFDSVIGTTKTNMLKLYQSDTHSILNEGSLCRSNNLRLSPTAHVLKIEFASGYSIQSIIDRCSPELVNSISKSIVEILLHIYSILNKLANKFIHCDLNSGNVIISDINNPPYKHRIKFIDYGTCKINISNSVCATINKGENTCMRSYGDTCNNYNYNLDNNWVDLIYMVEVIDLLKTSKHDCSLILDHIKFPTIISSKDKLPSKRDSTYSSGTISNIADALAWAKETFDTLPS